MLDGTCCLKMSAHDREQDLLSVPDVAAIFRRHERTIWRWLADGVLNSIKVGGSRYVRRIDVEAVVSAPAPRGPREGGK